MNKPLVAAIAGVSFGLFLGGLFLRNHERGTCPRTLQITAHAMSGTLQNAPPPRRVASPCTRQNHSEAQEPEQDVLSQAQSAYVNGEFTQAIKLARTGEKEQPLRAWRIIGAAACNLPDLNLIDQAFARVDAPSRQYLVYVCHRNSIILHGKHFRIHKGE